MTRGDIHVAAARGAYAGNPRSVVIVQDDRFDATNSVTVRPLTTAPVAAPLARIPVDSSETTGVEQQSWIMVDKLPTLPRGDIRDRIGQLSGSDLVRLNRTLVVFLGLAP